MRGREQGGKADGAARRGPRRSDREAPGLRYPRFFHLLRLLVGEFRLRVERLISDRECGGPIDFR
jgi:hypothetical protein